MNKRRIGWAILISLSAAMFAMWCVLLGPTAVLVGFVAPLLLAGLAVYACHLVNADQGDKR